MNNRVGDADDAGDFGDVVDADDVRPAENCRSHRGGGAKQPLTRRQGRFAWPGKSFAKESLARGADHNGAAEARELGQPGEDFEILFMGLAKSNSRVEQEL